MTGRAEMETFSLQHSRREQGNAKPPSGGREVETFIRKASRRYVHEGITVRAKAKLSGLPEEGVEIHVHS